MRQRNRKQGSMRQRSMKQRGKRPGIIRQQEHQSSREQERNRKAREQIAKEARDERAVDQENPGPRTTYTENQIANTLANPKQPTPSTREHQAQHTNQ
jgi:hypothetical protein